MSHLLHFLVGFAILLHVAFWGAGAALLIMPRPWRRFWPALIPAMGFALQSAVVWFAAHAGWRGTNSYAWAVELLPAVLLAAGLRWHGVRAAWIDVQRFGLVWLLTGATLALLILPLAIASRGLTTISLGSCDAADYAAGARVLQEFARGDREGFLGLTEVVRVMSVDNFFDYWTRLNHFTPAALIALNGTVVDCAPHEVTSLMTMVLLAGSLPLVFWMARAVLGYSGGVALLAALLYGVSPLTWYAVGHVAPAQLLAAQAIALLTWAGVALWRGQLTWRRGRRFGGVLAASYWLVLGSYNFILLVALVPAVAIAGGHAVWRRRWRRLVQWSAIMLAPLVVAGVLFFPRVAGLIERFTLLRAYDFGWRIPPLTPEGWLGIVSGPRLEPWDFLGVRWIALAIFGGAFVWALWRAVRREHPAAWVVAAIIVPVMIGYYYLQLRAVRLGTNASYDAYKLFAVFYPLLLPALCWWITLRRSRRLVEWMGTVGLVGVLLAVNLVATAMFVFHLARPPLIVDAALRQLRRIEAMPDVASVNLLLPNMWERLWANAFLLRKPQYFLTDTYEARWATPLRGEWNLESDLVRIGDQPERFSELPHHRLVKAGESARLRVEFGRGWYDEERHGGERWRWSRRAATLRVVNATGTVQVFESRLEARSLAPRALRIAGAVSGNLERTIGRERHAVSLGRWSLPPGDHEVTFDLPAGTDAAKGDERELGVCVHRLVFVPVE